MARILTPNKDYTGVSAGVVFEKGEGHTDDSYLISWFREHGYEVEETPESPAEPADLPQDAFEMGDGTDIPETASEASEGHTEGESPADEETGPVDARRSAVAPAQKKPGRKAK